MGDSLSSLASPFRATSPVDSRDALPVQQSLPPSRVKGKLENSGPVPSKTPLTIIVTPASFSYLSSPIPMSDSPTPISLGRDQPEAPVDPIVSSPLRAPIAPILQNNTLPVNSNGSAFSSLAPMSTISPASAPAPLPLSRSISSDENSTRIQPIATQNHTKPSFPSNEKKNVTIQDRQSESSPANNDFTTDPSGVPAGKIAIAGLFFLLIGILLGVFFWRRRRKSQAERRNAAAGMEDVFVLPPGGTGDEKMTACQTSGLKGSISSGADEKGQGESQYDCGNFFGRKGIMRSSRPTSLLLSEALEQAKSKTNVLAVGQTPSQQSHDDPASQPQARPCYDPEPAAHLRHNKPANRPASWRSSIAVTWASLGIPTRLLDPGTRMSPGGSIERGETRESPQSRNLFKGLYHSYSRRQNQPRERFNGIAALKRERASQAISEETEADRQSTMSYEIGSSTHQTESVKTGSTSGPQTTGKSDISMLPSTSGTACSSHSGSTSTQDMQLSEIHTSIATESNINHNTSPSSVISRAEDKRPIEASEQNSLAQPPCPFNPSSPNSIGISKIEMPIEMVGHAL